MTKRPFSSVNNDNHSRSSTDLNKRRTPQRSFAPAYSASASPTPSIPLPSPLPPLPPIESERLRIEPFRHSSTTRKTREISTSQLQSYDQLEFLGDAYLELFASRLIFSRYPHLPAGQMSQLREQLVKNETLARYSLAYGFDQKLQISEQERASMRNDSAGRGNKGFNKIMGDVWEAHLAAVVLDDDSHDAGMAKAETWMLELWQPKLQEVVGKIHTAASSRSTCATERSSDTQQWEYSDTAKAVLQKRIGGPNVRIEYEPYKSSVELKGDQLGQTRHYIAVYLTAFEYERLCLGTGEGSNKVEAGNWAAIEAIHGEKQNIVLDCERRLDAAREAKRLRA